jgi:membrane protein implicated in regulation of membrane protease activity
VGVIYLAALVFGLGTALVQLFMGSDGDADVDHGDLDHADLDGDVDHGDVDHGDVHGHGDLGILPIFLSLRFWVFGLMAFGLVGTPLHYLGVASPRITAVLAGAMGLLLGALASWVFRALSRQQVTSGGAATDPVGHVGKVLVPLAAGGRGKVRVQVKGQTLDLLARTDEQELREGELVLVEEMRQGEAQVSRAPSDFLPKS